MRARVPVTHLPRLRNQPGQAHHTTSAAALRRRPVAITVTGLRDSATHYVRAPGPEKFRSGPMRALISSRAITAPRATLENRAAVQTVRLSRDADTREISRD